MKKRIIAIVLALVLTAALCGCGCEHQWQEASCIEAKTCTLCGETEGAALGEKAHQWQDATTEQPLTCAVCGLKAGDPIETDERFSTAACADVFGQWSTERPMPLSILGIYDGGEVPAEYIYTFKNNGEYELLINCLDVEAVIDHVVEMAVAQTAEQGYAIAEANGKSREQVISDAGMTLEEVGRQGIEESSKALEAHQMIRDELSGGIKASGVYYVENGQIYMGYNWANITEKLSLSIEGDTMQLGKDTYTSVS